MELHVTIGYINEQKLLGRADNFTQLHHLHARDIAI